MSVAAEPGGAKAGVALEAVGISKRYGSLLANDSIDLAVRIGEVHAVMGENGAGKSTLMSILYGLVSPDSGKVLLRGREVRFRSALDAIAGGLGMVHQAFKLFNTMTVWENIVFGQEPAKGVFIDGKAARARVTELAERYHLFVEPDAVVGKLSVGVRQRVEILKALYRDSNVLILDEPTAVLTPQERDGLFRVIRNLTADGRTVLIVTHKLHEVMAITDRVTVLRDGRVVDRMVTRQTSPREIIRAMTGRAVSLDVVKAPTKVAEVALEATDVTVAAESGRPAVGAVSLTVRKGEIVGIAGVAGNGQTELIEALTGLIRPDRGSVRINGQDVTGLNVEAHRHAGLAYIPEDRATTGTALPANACDNFTMGFQAAPPLSTSGVLDSGAMLERARKLIDRFGVKIAGPHVPVRTLSGGNLQKIVLARELSHNASVLIAEQPTRGVDVGAIEFVHARLVEERDRGCAILLVSAELTEVLALSDRILVMFEGRVVADLAASEASEEKLGLLMAGRTAEAA